MIISLDCFMSKSLLVKMTNYIPTFYLKVLLFGLSPIIFGLFSLLVWMLIDFFMKRFKNREIDVKLNI
jgi:membrane protein required for beta-lactamase induction